VKVTSSVPTFADNVSLPVHGWFRFPAGFSASWVKDVVSFEMQARPTLTLLDPFAGVGTAVLAAEEAGAAAFGIEAHPFVARIAGAKLLWKNSPYEFGEFAREVLSRAQQCSQSPEGYPPLITSCYTPEALQILHSLKLAWQSLADGSPASELTWLAITAILRTTSHVGTAPWQYILPQKSKDAVSPVPAFGKQIEKMASDMVMRQMLGIQQRGKISLDDARVGRTIPDHSVDVVVTSPPYANNYDYADATRLEMSFWGEVAGWRDLQSTIRQFLIRSSSQHVSAEHSTVDEYLRQLATSSFYEEITGKCKELGAERLEHGGKKAYHVMIAAYFRDMLHVWMSLRRVTKSPAKVCFVIGDSAPYGVYIPVERWMGELALQAGFSTWRFEKVRDRNIKWKNRKHRVPLKEGFLWVEG
jgi:hypothetical protein